MAKKPLHAVRNTSLEVVPFIGVSNGIFCATNIRIVYYCTLAMLLLLKPNQNIIIWKGPDKAKMPQSRPSRARREKGEDGLSEKLVNKYWVQTHAKNTK